MDLHDIYFRGAITFRHFKLVDKICSINRTKVLIEGGPGQGKSLYLKHLCLTEATKGKLIPIFIEFRNLAFTKPLQDELMEQIRCFGIDVNDDVFDYLCKSTRLLFILDGFDEISSKARLQAARQLEFIARTYKNLMIVSSRPEAGLGGSVYFHTFTIEPLSLELQEGFLDHLFKGRQESAPVVNIVRTNEFIAGVTKTPLLLTLLAITYKASHFKPASVSEFYRIIFPTMLYRHDRIKIGFERERKSGLSDYLEASSFISMKHGNVRFNSSKFKAHLVTSLKYERTKPNIEHVIEDITLITGLIVRDGYDSY